MLVCLKVYEYACSHVGEKERRKDVKKESPWFSVLGDQEDDDDEKMREAVHAQEEGKY